MLCLALAATLTAVANDRFYIDDFSVNAGDTIEVSIMLDNEMDYTAFQSDLYLPEGFTVLQNANGSYQMALTDRKARSHTFSTQMQSDGSIRMLSYSTALAAYKNNSGALVILTLTAAEDFTGPSAIVLKNTLFTTLDGVEVAFPDETCTVTIATTALPGDVNNDGSVNIADVTALIDLLLGGGSISNPAADCNQDSSINISDVTALIDYLLSGSWN